jgi:hypothetical protein
MRRFVFTNEIIVNEAGVVFVEKSNHQITHSSLRTLPHHRLFRFAESRFHSIRVEQLGAPRSLERPHELRHEIGIHVVSMT